MRSTHIWFILLLIGLLVILPACGIAEPPNRAKGGVVSTATLAPTDVAGATVSPVTSQTSTPDVPTDPADPTPGIAEDAACDARVMGSSVLFEPIAELAWSSHQVVVGTVTERLPAAKVTVEGSMLPFTIVRDVNLAVEEQFRGQPADDVWIRTLGGSVGSCSQEFPDSPQLEPGDRVLVFLRRIKGADRNVYEFVGSPQGHWTVSTDGMVTTEAAHLLPGGQPAPLTTIEATIVSALAAGPPANSPLLDQFLVPTEEAPITPDVTKTATATP